MNIYICDRCDEKTEKEDLDIISHHIRKGVGGDSSNHEQSFDICKRCIPHLLSDLKKGVDT